VLFSRLNYVQLKSYKLGVLTDKELLKLDIALEWHKANQIASDKEQVKQNKKEEYNALINRVNKDFKENYIE